MLPWPQHTHRYIQAKIDTQKTQKRACKGEERERESEREGERGEESQNRNDQVNGHNNSATTVRSSLLR